MSRCLRTALITASAVVALGTVAAATTSAWGSPQTDAESADGFRGEVEQLSPKLRKRMTGITWHEGCPVGLGELRLVRATYVDFKGRDRQGSVVVRDRYAGGMLKVLRRLHAKGFPIRRMELIDRYGGDDHRSMAADNTSAFNCRFVAGTDRWSRHAYGEAIDINPRENPYVSGSHVSPPEGAPYADRSDRRKGMIFKRDVVTNSFDRILGWEWGGLWPNPTDYQHLSADGT